MSVLDASALLALLFKEPGHERVAVAADGALASTVNLAEVLTRFVRDGHNAPAVLQHLAIYAIEWVHSTTCRRPVRQRFGHKRAEPVCRWPIAPA
jgi:PIN domain nuclease of toxin-antitoxin system